MRPVLMHRVRAFLERRERMKSEGARYQAEHEVEEWINKKAAESYKRHKKVVKLMKERGRKRKLTPRSRHYYRKKWRKFLVEKALEDRPAKMDIKKVNAFIGKGDEIPTCVNDVVECFIPQITTQYPTHWPRDIAMELFYVHHVGFEGDWIRQRRYY